jgi:hypothetical protein
MDKPAKPSPGDMAWLVGEALRANGIKIRQTKEKFGSIRIYVSVPNTHEARVAYREVYLSAMRACPELKANLRNGADYNDWLFETEKELDEYIARVAERGGENTLALWDPRFRLARALIRNEDTTPFNTTEDEE